MLDSATFTVTRARPAVEELNRPSTVKFVRIPRFDMPGEFAFPVMFISQRRSQPFRCCPHQSPKSFFQLLATFELDPQPLFESNDGTR